MDFDPNVVHISSKILLNPFFYELIRVNYSQTITMGFRVFGQALNKVSSVPRQREINKFLAKKICKDLEIPVP